MKKKLLTQMVEQYHLKHQRKPIRIVVTPAALLALAIKRTVAPLWAGIPLECREIDITEVAQSGPKLGIDIQGEFLASFDLS